ncbi:MAG: DinB family protein [Bryobacteraceae bacterium]
MLNAEQAKSMADMFLGMIEHEMKTTRRVLAAVPEDKLDFKLGEKGRTARELMWHLAASEPWFLSGIAAGEFSMEGEPPAPQTAAEVLAFYDKEAPATLERCKALAGEQLAKPVNFFNVFNLPAGMYLNFCMVHSVHHRGQLSTYLRAMNARVPDIYGGSADEPFQMPATAC